MVCLPSYAAEDNSDPQVQGKRLIGRLGVGMLAALALVATTYGPTLFVSPNGLDSGDGSAKHPLASLHRAVELSRSRRIKQIQLSAGEYRFTESLKLDSRDNGLTIKGATGARTVLTGAEKIDPRLSRPCTDPAILDRIIELSARAKVRSIDLSRSSDPLSSMSAYGFPKPITAAPNELFSNQTPFTVARWPNTGFSKTLSVSEPGNGEKDRNAPKRQPVITIDDRAKSWGQAKNVWLYGYWFYDWADENMAVASIDPGSATITLAGPHSYGVRKGAPFFAQNLLEELDQPGEYFLDAPRRMLYYFPMAVAEVLLLSTLAEPVITIDSASNLTIRGLDFAYSRGDGVVVRNSKSVRIEASQFYDLGQRAAVIEGSTRSGLDGCNIWQTGEGGVALSGGDRLTLASAENFVRNCDIHHFQRRTQTYRPAVLISGVGNVVAHCDMHDAPHSAIIFSGNDHVIEFNRFYRTLARTGDGGVVYTGRDWTARGTQIRFNHFFDNVGEGKWEPAIYFDDLASGLTAKGNLIERCHWGFLIGGGRDNVLEENVIVDCKLGFHGDARGLGWAASSKPTMVERLNAVPVGSPVWRRRYPQLSEILEHDPMAPIGNVLRRNLLMRSGTLLKDFEAPFAKSVTLDSNKESSQSGAWGEVTDAPKLPVRQMGLISDAIRKSLPKSP